MKKRVSANLQHTALYNSLISKPDDFNSLLSNNFFQDPQQWNTTIPGEDIPGIRDTISHRMKYAMSTLALGVYNAMEKGPDAFIEPDDEIFLISGFTEINNINKIGTLIMTENYSINPALFPNSVHHISLCYYTILKKKTNCTAAITDGLSTPLSVINFFSNRIQLHSPFVMACGDEPSEFFSYEKDHPITIVPSFAAYRVIPSYDKGIYYDNFFEDKQDLLSYLSPLTKDAIWCCKDTFFDFQDTPIANKLYTDYPLTRDNPSALAFRIAVPFYYLENPAKSCILHKMETGYHLFNIR